MPRERNSSSAVRRCLVERANRSKRHTTIASNCRLRASSMSLLSSGRESFAPDWPTSLYSGRGQILGPRSSPADRVLEVHSFGPSCLRVHIFRFAWLCSTGEERNRLICAHSSFLASEQ